MTAYIRTAMWRGIVHSGTLWLLTVGVVTSVPHRAFGEQPPIAGFRPQPPFAEWVRWTRLDSGVRVLVNLPPSRATTEVQKPRTLVIYATPNGNSIEQTYGCRVTSTQDGATTSNTTPDWRYDIQHVAAQIRHWRAIDDSREWILAIVQAPQLSWTAFRRDQSQAEAIIRELVTSLAKETQAEKVILSGHSGGGSFLFGAINSEDTVSPLIDRIVFLDANYSYSDDQHHGDKLLSWLRGASHRHLIVIAYDDREITLNGQKVVGPDGGTFRATARMRARFLRDIELTDHRHGSFQESHGLAGQVRLIVHPNPENKILHTALVGEMNGLLHALAIGTTLDKKWGTFGGPRAYTDWIASDPVTERTTPRARLEREMPTVRLKIPQRPAAAVTGSEFARQIALLPRTERETSIARELEFGNLPEFLRELKAIRVSHQEADSKNYDAVFFVMPDYLAVGSDTNFFRVPITPATAMSLADRFEASFVTTKVVDDVFAAAELKLTPRPMTKDRDAAATFWEHHLFIEEQFGKSPRGQLVSGIKKDVVLSNRLKEKPHKVAIYGWHYPDGHPIQSLYVGHVDWYVDYSHGVRLMSREVRINEKSYAIEDILNDPQRCPLLSNEGPIDIAAIRKAAEWVRPASTSKTSPQSR